ncbi:MAG: DUF3488 and transglutaminase-like domain-containing protein [Woeseiaceae bacterium]
MLLNSLLKPNINLAKLLLLLGMFLVFIPHFSHLPLWLSLFMIGLLLWRGAHDLHFCGLPNKIILFLITLLLLTGLLFSYHTLIGRNAGSAMLLGLLALKLFEIKSYRDVALIVHLALFSIVINFLFSQSILVAIIMIFALIILFTALVGFQHDYKTIHHEETFSLKTIKFYEQQHFKLTLKMLAQAIPFAIVLFILFPRVNGPLWGLPEDAFSGKTGLSDQMSPGRISQLSNNNAVAFRVKFSSKVPAASHLYWRGPVMWDFNGYDWTSPDNERLAISSYNFTGRGKKTNYEITLQPHNNYWLFALDIPSTLPEKARFSANMQMVSLRPVQTLKQYTLSSYTQYVMPAYSQITLQRYLKLPNVFLDESESMLYQSRRLMSKLKVNGDNKKTIDNVLNYFATEDFYYSRKPPLLYNNPVDEFLFDSKRGYCEHYASSFTVLMRLAGIPSRVVTGYQGGEINPIDHYMTVRQSDAHAWSEVFLDEKGWVRIDPTASIPPENIENNDDALRLNSNRKKPSYLYDTSWLSTQFKQARHTWDAINNRWNQWILGYNTQQQKAFFQALGIPDISWQGLSQLLFSILAVLTALLSYVVFSVKHKTNDICQRYYLKFIKKSALEKKAYEGAEDFSLRLIQAIPHKKQLIIEITHLYQYLRYNCFNHDDLSSFKQKINNFKR